MKKIIVAKNDKGRRVDAFLKKLMPKGNALYLTGLPLKRI